MLGFPLRNAPNEFVVGLIWEDDLQLDEMIAVFILRRHPFASEPQNRAGIGPFRNCKLDDARHGIDPYLGPCQRLADGHRESRADVATLASEVCCPPLRGAASPEVAR